MSNPDSLVLNGSAKETGQFNGIIRPAELNDAEQLRPILETWIQWQGQIIESEVEEVLNNLKESIETGNDYHFLVAETTSKEVVGMIGFRQPPDKRMLAYCHTDKPVELVNAFVSEKHRKGKGIGRTLVNRLELEARKIGAKEVILNSGPRYKNSGWGFYDRIGYEKVGTARHYYGVGFHAPVWRKELPSSEVELTNGGDKSDAELEASSFELKTVMYEGFQPSTRAEVTYMRKGNQIIFSATGKNEGFVPTTINAAEKVIKAICEQEKIEWKEFEFFDFQTPLGGYSRHEPGRTTALDRLVLDKRGEDPNVEAWNTIFDTNLDIGLGGFQETLFELTSGDST